MAKYRMPQVSLKAARINAGLSREELADMLGVSPKTIGKWEVKESKIKPIYLYGIAYVLRISADSIRI